MTANTSWFTEHCKEAGTKFSFELEAHLHHEKSAYQTIDIYQTTHWGNLMVIDGCVMLTARDNFFYHEMMSHPALFSHPDPKRVLIIGGGDCGTLKEVLRHKAIKEVTQVEIDERVTRLSEQYFPELCESNTNPRAKLRFDDGIEYIKQAPASSIDIIIVDSTDPVGPAEGLFGQGFVQACHRALTQEGIMVQQSESPLIHQDILQSLRTNMHKAGFSDIRTLPFPQPCYPSGWWSCTLAKKGGPLDQFKGDAHRDFQTLYYNETVHAAAIRPNPFTQDNTRKPG